MLENSRREIAGGLARVQGELTSLRRNAEVIEVPAEAKAIVRIAQGGGDEWQDDDEDADDVVATR
jgi:hypothetical protein